MRVPTSEKDKYDSFLFSDSVHGGKRKALLKAREFRDDEFKKRDIESRLNPKWRVGEGVGPHSRQRNNTSGIIGVSKVVQLHQDGWTYTAWVAYWRENEKQTRKQYNCFKHTEAVAFTLACIDRIKNAGSLQIVNKKARFPISRRKIEKLNEEHG